MQSSKENAKEYLKEFAASEPNWLKALIYEIIETNGNISEDKKEKIFNCLKDGDPLTINEPRINNNSENEVYIISLEHIKGVNALKQNQMIKFHNDVTILYGLNGAGKSSYFKILNEIVGGNQKKEILPNIYLDTQQAIDVKISFQEKSRKIRTINWDGNTRSIDFFDKCKVFDSSYLNGLLETRKADTTLIQPLGLNLFSDLVDLVNDFKRKLNSEADEKKLEKPILELKYLGDEIKTSFEKHQVTDSIKTQIERLFVFTTEDSEKQTRSIQKLQELKQINIQDKITLKNSDKTDINNIKSYIESTNKQLSNFYSDGQAQLELLDENKKASELAKKQFEILSTISNSDNPEWKKFIKSGEEYKSKVDDSDKVCIYCRQPLQDENATKLIKSYGKFLKDSSEKSLSDSLKEIKKLRKGIETLSVELEIKDNTQKILQNNKLEVNEVTLYKTIVNINTKFSVEKKQLFDKLESEDLSLKIDFIDIKNITIKLESISKGIESEVNNLSEEETKKSGEIEKVEKLLKQFQENESINKQKEDIRKWLKLDKLMNDLKDKANTIHTAKITNVSKRAHNDLLTERLKQNFTDELNFLGYKGLSIKIENAKGEKGTSSTKLTLSRNNDIKAILSEGEQKAVALALFIAESKIQKNKNPIILDDPVNSLDHKIAGKFAQQLLQLDNQVILFNHNRLFLDAFETSKKNHICKTIDSDCSKEKGRHVRIYQISSEGKNTKGVLINYKSNKAKEHISEAERLLNQSLFNDGINVAILLRKTVECVIDEVIFNNQLPTKYSNKNSRIVWSELKKLKSDGVIIDKLEAIHSRVSGGEMHNGTENEENPIEVEEFKTMILDINKILNSSVQ